MAVRYVPGYFHSLFGVPAARRIRISSGKDGFADSENIN
jgi:hypothetical protein